MKETINSELEKTKFWSRYIWFNQHLCSLPTGVPPRRVGAFPPMKTFLILSSISSHKSVDYSYWNLSKLHLHFEICLHGHRMEACQKFLGLLNSTAIGTGTLLRSVSLIVIVDVWIVLEGRLFSVTSSTLVFITNMFSDFCSCGVDLYTALLYWLITFTVI